MYHKLRAYIKPVNVITNPTHDYNGTVHRVQFMDYSEDNPLIKLFDVDQFFRPHQVELMVDTGIEDVNGKLVYQGDIVEDLRTEESFVVEYEDGCFYRKIKGNIREEMVDFDGEFPYEVVGNKYEHPYLLES